LFSHGAISSAESATAPGLLAGHYKRSQKQFETTDEPEKAFTAKDAKDAKENKARSFTEITNLMIAAASS
jgi:hypothetical protein